MSFETNLVIAAIAILLVVNMVQGTFHILSHGVKNALGNRAEPKILEGLEGRLERTRANTADNVLMFVPLMLVAIATNVSTPWIQYSGTLFVGARLVYVFAYAGGIQGLRTLCWTAGVVGIVGVAIGLL